MEAQDIQQRSARALLWARGRAAAWAVALGLTGGVASAGPLISLIDTQLAAIAPDSGSAVYNAGGAVLTVSEDSTSTMTGSLNFEYEGLWLGSDGTGGAYSFGFSAPVSMISFHFIALTAFAGEEPETLRNFLTSAASTASFSSSDGSASWDGSVLTPLDEDSRGVLTFTSTGAAGFSSISFEHLQALQLQGVVIEQIDFSLADGVTTDVPAPATAWLMGAALCGLWRQRRQRQQHTLTAIPR